MSYTPATDFVGIWRTIAGGVEKGELPGLDFIVAGLGRAGLINVTVSGVAPVANQATTAWFQPASPSYSAEGTLWLWNASASAYAAATPALFRQFLEASFGSTGIAWLTTTGGAPSNAVGNNGDLAIRTDTPGGIYGPKAAGVWPVNPLPGTSYSNTTNALDFAFGTTQGMVLYRGAGAWQALAPGSAGQTLTSGGPGGNPTWTNLSNTVNSAALDASFGNTVGNLIYRAAGSWQSLNISATPNSVLTNSGGVPTWSAVSGLIDNAFSAVRGSVLYRGATSWAALGPGTSGYVLTSGGAGADPSWAAGGAGGGVTSAALDTAFGSTVGGVLVRGTGGWTNVGVGTAGYVLTAHGAGANVTWSPQTGTTVSGAIGSLIVANTAADFAVQYVTPGATRSGSALQYLAADASGYVNAGLTGTWISLGGVGAGYMSLYQRIS